MAETKQLLASTEKNLMAALCRSTKRSQEKTDRVEVVEAVEGDEADTVEAAEVMVGTDDTKFIEK